ncbi:MAG: O-acetyl-ADP-ribose deacetylase [Planctomycetota bacterium]|jgi:O-acetyl-ADP-ribose deacetylase (regulator of RNase III)|nr:O-acetyl-ADP-ribose deacetylase [Planctomycetota bacterium]
MDRIELHQGDITALDVDAIVTAANSSLSGGAGVDGAIHRAAGPELLAACQQLGGCPSGEARITPGFQLQARHCIHAVGPIWYGGDRGEAQVLATAYQASCALAAQAGCRSLAFPAISCGIYGYPLDQAAQISVASIWGWCASNELPERVILCAIDDEAYAAWERALSG